MARTKQDLIDALAALGITNTSGTEAIAPLTGNETMADLRAILAKAKGEPDGAEDDNEPEPLKPGIVKEYTQNGMRYQRIRKEDGSMVDVRI
jgi:hypothetical protein